MSEAIIFENMPYNLFLKQRMEFVVICGDHLAANVMRVFEAEMIKRKEAWQVRVEKAIEAKKPLPKEPQTWWVQLSQAQIIARLYMYDSAKLKKPESEDMNSPEWIEYRFKKALSISKGTLRKAIELLKSLGFLLEKGKDGDEFGSPMYMLHKANVQNALKALPANPFTIFHHLGGDTNFVSGGEVQNLNVPGSKNESGEVQNLNVPGSKNESGEVQNLEVDIDINIDSPEDSEIDNEIECTYPVSSACDDESGSVEPTRTHSLSDNSQVKGATYGRSDDNNHLLSGHARRDAAAVRGTEPVRVSSQQQAGEHEIHPAESVAARAGRGARTESGATQAGLVNENNNHSRLSTLQQSSPQQSAKVDPASSRRRQPRAPKVDPAEIQRYLEVFDRLFQEVTGNPDEGYICSGEDRKELTTLLEANLKKPRYVTPEKLRVVYLRLWNKPKDERTGFHWQEHMKIKNVCKQYPQEAMTLSAQASQKAAKNAPEKTVSGLKRWTPPSGTPAQV